MENKDIKKKPLHLEKRFKRDLNNKQQQPQQQQRKLELAEINRNHYLEQRRENSKKVVERAKHVALQNQIKSEQEQERKRAELKNRLEKTEERRLAHLNKFKKNKISSSSSSSKSMLTSTTPQITNTDLPKKKPSNWSIILKAFKELNLPSPSNPSTWLKFNSLEKLLYQPKVIVVTTKVLNTALKLNDENSRHRARVLLTSYMMLMCPKEVLQDTNGLEERRLHTSAKQMLHLFEIWLRAHGRPGATAARLAFVDAWNDYNVLFENWKSRDRDLLLKNMIDYYIELDTLRKSMQSNDVSEQLTQQLEQVKAKIEKLGGLDKLQLSIQTTATTEQINTPRTPLVDDQQPISASPDINQLLNVVPPSFGITNDQLAHELIIDPDFKLERYEPQHDLERRVKEMAEKAFFDKIAHDIEHGQPELSLLLLAKDVKSRLLSLVKSGTPVYNSIDEAIDLGLIDQELKQNSFDMQKMINYVLDTASNMCAPVRDEEIQIARQTDGMINQIKLIFEILENMSLDLVNFRLRSLRPHLMSIAVEYEREKFAKMLNDGTIQLVRTNVWLNKSVDKLCQVAAQRNPEGVQPQTNKPTHDAVFEDALVSLLSQSTPAIQDLPETFILDTKRMNEFQNEVQAITIVAALLMLARNFGSASPQALSDLAQRLFTMLADDTITIDNLSAEIERSVHVRPERKEMVRTMVDKTVSHNDTVYSLLLRRIGSVIKSTIQNNKFVTDAVLTSNGLEHVKGQLQSLAIKIQRLAHHHKKVNSTWYDQIITEALNNHQIA